MADLDNVATSFRLRHDRRLRVATKYINLTRGFFARHGIVDYRIVESAGATEGAPAAGTADLIVDITTTGATLAANGLKVDRGWRHFAVAGEPRGGAPAHWSRGRACEARLILDRIAGRRGRASIRRCAHALPVATRAVAYRRQKLRSDAPFGGPTSSGMLTLHCPPDHVHGLASFLRQHGAESVIVAGIDYVFTRDNPLYAKLTAAL